MMMSSIFCIVLVFSFHACSNARPIGFGARESHLKPVLPSRMSNELSTSHDHHVIVWAKMEETNNSKDANDSLNVRETSIQDSTDDESQVLKRQGAGRSILQRDNVEEKVNSIKEHESVEDVVAMDYAQPQRKPPIHNQKKP